MAFRVGVMKWLVVFGVKLAVPKGNVFVLVGDGSYLMMHSELLTCIQENQKSSSCYLIIMVISAFGIYSARTAVLDLGMSLSIDPVH